MTLLLYSILVFCSFTNAAETKVKGMTVMELYKAMGAVEMFEQTEASEESELYVESKLG